MKQNISRWERVLRAAGGTAMLTCGVFAPLPLVARVLALGGGGAYMLATALFGSCLGYRMMGISTCPVERGKAP
jgi:hypothetical protein